MLVLIIYGGNIMVFESIDSAINYIKNAVASCMPECADEIKMIIDDETISQVEGWSGDIFNSVMPESDSTSAEAYFSDNGAWFSLITGEPVPNPIRFLEAGSTWNRGASNIMDTAFNKCEDIVTKEFIEMLRSRGIPVE